MTRALPEFKLYTVDEFMDFYPENSLNRYELHNGVIKEMAPPNAKHEGVVGFLALEIAVEAKKLNKNLRIPKTAFIKIPENETLYSPDILVQNYDNAINEPLWNKQPILCLPESIPLVVEVVSTNWDDDYYKKFADYQRMDIPEYWIVDYAALGGRNFIGNPKIPTIFICELIDGEYEITAFRDNDRIISPTFPQLNLTAQQVFDSVA